MSTDRRGHHAVVLARATPTLPSVSSMFMAVEGDLWRALTAFRALALAYAVILYAVAGEGYDRMVLGWIVLAGMAAWTVVTTVLYARPARRRSAFLALDLLVAWAAIIASSLADSDRATVEPTVPVLWAAAAVVAAGLGRGPLAGLLAGLSTGVVVIAVRGGVDGTVVNNVVLLALGGSLIGWIAALSQRAAAALAAVAATEARERERDRLGRVVHDGVLQVLDLVHLRGPALGPEGAELARLAGDQEAALRALVATGSDAPALAGVVDLAGALAGLGSARVSVAVPAEPVWVAPPVGGELVAAVRAALDNVDRHAGPGARAWVLLEDDGDLVLTVRDDGVGLPSGRLAAAAAEGRLGVAGSIVGRVGDLGGRAVIDSAPGAGTEIEIVLPGSARGLRGTS